MGLVCFFQLFFWRWGGLRLGKEVREMLVGWVRLLWYKVEFDRSFYKVGQGGWGMQVEKGKKIYSFCKGFREEGFFECSFEGRWVGFWQVGYWEGILGRGDGVRRGGRKQFLYKFLDNFQRIVIEYILGWGLKRYLSFSQSCFGMRFLEGRVDRKGLFICGGFKGEKYI